MSQSEKAQLYNELKAAGVKFDRHYREYSTEELQVAVQELRKLQPEQTPQPTPEPDFDPAATAAALRQPFLSEERQAKEAGPRVPQAPPVPVAAANPNEMPGQRQNTKPADQPIRVDEQGLVWFQEEVRKSAMPKPRGRRVLTYMDSGVQTEKVQAGQYVESFEVAGSGPGRPTEVKITLPSYQVGIYKDPRFPFKIHVYNENRGFNLFEVQDYYGGSEMVPPEIKKVYVENVLCYDIRTVVRAIQTEFRQLQLQGKVK